LIALLPLVLVGVGNKLLTDLIPRIYGSTQSFIPAVVGEAAPVVQEVSKIAAIWAVEGALLLGIVCVLVFAWRPVRERFAEGSKLAVSGALLASMNTASEYGFGAVIAALPGFKLVADALHSIPDPLVNEAVTVTALAGITGSASGGMSIALGAMAQTFIHNAQAAGIPMEVLHRVAAMASGGMDTLPHNGAVITLLAVTGLTHRQAYKDIFAITVIKTLAVAVVIAAYYLTGVVYKPHQRQHGASGLHPPRAGRRRPRARRWCQDRDDRLPATPRPLARQQCAGQPGGAGRYPRRQHRPCERGRERPDRRAFQCHATAEGQSGHCRQAPWSCAGDAGAGPRPGMVVQPARYSGQAPAARLPATLTRPVPNLPGPGAVPRIRRQGAPECGGTRPGTLPRKPV